MVFESLGGVSTEADGVIKCLNKCVASATDSPEGEVATLFWQRLSIGSSTYWPQGFCEEDGGGS
eukprot:879105-Karenia_brevis.AAC.1